MTTEVATFICHKFKNGRERTQGCNLISCECHQKAFNNYRKAGRIVGEIVSVDENNVPTIRELK